MADKRRLTREQLASVVQRGHAAGLTEDQLKQIVGVVDVIPATEATLGKATSIGPDNPSMFERLLRKTSDLGPVPGVLAGAARQTAGGIADLGNMLLPGQPIPRPGVAAGPDETLGAKGNGSPREPDNSRHTGTNSCGVSREGCQWSQRSAVRGR